MSQATPSTTSPTPAERHSPGCLRRVLQAALVLLALGIVAAVAVIALAFVAPGAVRLPGAASLNPAERIALGAYLAANQSALETPAGPAGEPQRFVVESGGTAGTVAADLAAGGFILDPVLFQRYLRFFGLDVQLEAGTFLLSPGMTIPEIAYALTEAPPPDITLTVPEGWRREQLADWIDAQPQIPFTGAEFLAATESAAGLPPGSSPLASFLPAGATLEGFLFPDTYRLPLDATANDLVTRMAAAFAERITPEMEADITAQGRTVYEVVTIASIVEREAVVADERPEIAAVYLNRLAQGIKLEADPTVQYAMGYQPATGQWWNLNLTQADYYAVESPYNMYLYNGLPPSPIASPGLDSIRAVVYPATSPYLYFRAACDGSGRHVFARTFEEHLANACP